MRPAATAYRVSVVIPCLNEAENIHECVSRAQTVLAEHGIFGEVVEGYDVVAKISKLPRNSQDRPNKDVTIASLKIERS